MSLLAKPTPPTIDRIETETARIKNAPRRLIDTMVREWEPAFNLMWSSTGGITPTMRLAAIGEDAAELFASNTAFATFLVANLTGKDDAMVAHIMGKLAQIPAYTIHEDGTATID